MGLSSDPEKRLRQLRALAAHNPGAAAKADELERQIKAGTTPAPPAGPPPAGPAPRTVRAPAPPAAPKRRQSKPAKSRSTSAPRSPRAREPEPPPRRSRAREFLAGLFDV